MISRFFSRTARPTLTGAVPEGRRLYAIGDVHGRLDLLDRLLDQIHADSAARGSLDYELIFLGDLIDRGPESAGVVQRVLDLCSFRPSTRCLFGNHEEVFLKALKGDLKALAFFNKIGGRETVLSYGISPEAYLDSDYPTLLEMLVERVPAAHVDFIEQLEDMIILGDYAFVHAGVNPNEVLALQTPAELRWIRQPFLNHKHPLEKIIVHGHTVSEAVEIGRHRIGIDTGAYASGRLTAMGFENDQRWVLDTA
ncbi:metallophosphoesterase [Sphingomonas hengshuiensis]|uniref:Serine/threonine protein phosphatase n=1 Tax=Sphingomonas hengshuiensis TaxID=1609977 RepID=A0A7U4J999_9SPHN|nr:metallophosphoesterase [Sphingomonas hengshuiensis]AJP72591.1 serine/threonine protein phosphatase [Sphingomonas hengshuiensis]